jgi:hypothetical protein
MPRLTELHQAWIAMCLIARLARSSCLSGLCDAGGSSPNPSAGSSAPVLSLNVSVSGIVTDWYTSTWLSRIQAICNQLLRWARGLDNINTSPPHCLLHKEKTSRLWSRLSRLDVKLVLSVDIGVA